MKKIILMAAIIVIMCTAIGCNGVSKEEYDALLKENEALKAAQESENPEEMRPSLTHGNTNTEEPASTTTGIDINQIEGYIKAPDEIYHTNGSENGLTDTLMYVDGIVIDKTSWEEYAKEYDLETESMDGWAKDTSVLWLENGNGKIMLTRYGGPDAAMWDKMTKEHEDLDIDGWVGFEVGDQIRCWFEYQGFSGVTNTAAGMYQYGLLDGKTMEELSDVINVNYGYDLNDSPTISLDEFEAIITGMEYEEVCKIIGSEGELKGQSGNVKIYIWDGDGIAVANASITFVDNKVDSKAQTGLK